MDERDVKGGPVGKLVPSEETRKRDAHGVAVGSLVMQLAFVVAPLVLTAAGSRALRLDAVSRLENGRTALPPHCVLREAAQFAATVRGAGCVSTEDVT